MMHTSYIHNSMLTYDIFIPYAFPVDQTSTDPLINPPSIATLQTIFLANLYVGHIINWFFFFILIIANGWGQSQVSLASALRFFMGFRIVLCFVWLIVCFLTFFFLFDWEKQKVQGEKNEGEKKAADKKDDGKATAVFKMEMHCEGCAKKIRRAVRGLDGIHGNPWL